MFLQRIFHRTFQLAFTSLLAIGGSLDLSAQEIDSTLVLEKSGKKPRYQVKKSSNITNKQKSPFSIYSVPQVQSTVFRARMFCRSVV